MSLISPTVGYIYSRQFNTLYPIHPIIRTLVGIPSVDNYQDPIVSLHKFTSEGSAR